MYHQQNVKVFIGPYCNTGKSSIAFLGLIPTDLELDAVAKMAAYWNVSFWDDFTLEWYSS
jgi:hypothetical protein